MFDITLYVVRKDGLVKPKRTVLEFTHFSVDMFIVLGLDSCVTKGRWEKGKREKQEILWVFFPPACRQAGFPLVLHFFVRRYLLSSRKFPSATSGQALLKSYFLVFLLLLSSLFIPACRQAGFLSHL
jgi:hypothetical protein